MSQGRAVVDVEGDAFSAMVRQQLDTIQRELQDLRDLVKGRPDVGWQGILARIEINERLLTTLKDVQDGFVRDRDLERNERKRKDTTRNRIQVAVLGAFGAILSGVVIQLFVLITTGSPG